MDTEYLIRKDALGWKIAELASGESYDGYVFTLSTGEKVGKLSGWLVCAENLQAMAVGEPMQTPDQLITPPLTGNEMLNFLRRLGWCLDHEWRVRKFMREPFSKLTIHNIAPLIVGHINLCQSEEKALKTPILVGWFDGKAGIVVPPQVLMLPEGTGPEGIPAGKFCLYKDRMGRQRFMMRWGDWFLAPKMQTDGAAFCTLEVINRLQTLLEEDRLTDLDAESVEAFLGKDQFLTPEGLLVGKGSFLTISIDDFLKGL